MENIRQPILVRRRLCLLIMKPQLTSPVQRRVSFVDDYDAAISGVEVELRPLGKAGHQSW